MSDYGSGKTIVLNKNILVPVGIVFSLCLCIVGATTWLDNKFDSIQDSIEDLTDDVGSLQQARMNTMTMEYFKLWSQLFCAKNPNLIIPEIGS